MKKRIRLTENQLYKLVKMVLNESFRNDYLMYANKAVQINSEEDLDDFLSVVGHDYAQQIMGKVQIGDYIVPVGYADQGGSLGDWYVIEYFKKENPEHIAIQNVYGGVWGYIFGKEDFLEGEIREAIERSNTPYELTDGLIQEKIPEIVEEYGLHLDDKLNELLWNYLDEHITANFIDYDEDELKELLIQNGYLGGDNPNESLARRVTESIIRKLRRA